MTNSNFQMPQQNFQLPMQHQQPQQFDPNDSRYVPPQPQYDPNDSRYIPAGGFKHTLPPPRPTGHPDKYVNGEKVGVLCTFCDGDIEKYLDSIVPLS